MPACFVTENTLGVSTAPAKSIVFLFICVASAANGAERTLGTEWKAVKGKLHVGAH